MDVKKMSVLELLNLHASAIEELLERKIIRTANNPVADYAEYLVAKKLGLSLAANSTAGYDALDNKGIRYQIKCRRNTSRNSSKQLGVIRDLDGKYFDVLVAVIFDANFNVINAYRIPIDLISSYSRFSEHQRGHITKMAGKILEDKRVEDITALFT